MTQAGASAQPIPEHKNERDVPNLATVIEKSGLNFTQENGQLKYGPPTDWDGPLPAKGSEVFVGKVPRDISAEELVPVFETIGKIFEMRVMMDFEGNNRGYAFVMFSSPEEAKRAIKELDNYEIKKGRLIGVCKSVDNCRLFVGGIPKTKTKDDILEEMRKVTEAVSDVILYSSIADKSKNRGFAFIEYESHKAAAVARRKLMPGKIQLFGHDVAVDWAEPELEVDEDTMAKVTVLYVRNLMPNTTEDTIRETFSSENNFKIDKVKKLRDFAFVHYRNREDAEAALQALNGIQLEGSRLEVTWAKPVDKAFRPRSRSLPQSVPAYNHYLVGFDQFPGQFPFPPPMQVRPPMMQRFPFSRRGRGAAGIRRFRNYSPNNRNVTYKPVEMPIAAIPPPYSPYQSTKLSRIPEEGKAYHVPEYAYGSSSSTDETTVPTVSGPAVGPPYPTHARIAHHGYLPLAGPKCTCAAGGQCRSHTHNLLAQKGYEEGGYYFVPAHLPPGIVPMYG